VYESPPQLLFPDESSYYELYSIATPSFIPPHTLTIHRLYPTVIISNETQQPTRKEHLPNELHVPQAVNSGSIHHLQPLIIMPKKSKDKDAAGDDKQKKKKGRLKRGVGAIADPNGALLSIDPLLIRYQHSKIRPYFSGCGRSVKETYEECKEGVIDFDELPAIEIINPNR